MRLLKQVTDFYILSNIHVALAGFCMTKITLIKFGYSSNIMPFFVALSIIVSYNFIRFYEFKTNKLAALKSWFVEHSKSLFILSLFSGFGLVYMLLFIDFKLNSLKILFPFLLMTVFYVIPIFKIGNIEVSFRNFPGIKIFSISIAWAGIVVLFPLKEMGFELNSTSYIEFIQRIFILIAIIIPFDIRDFLIDPKNLKTLPQVLGVKSSKRLGFIFLFLFVMLTFLKENIADNEVFINIFISVITALFLGFSSPEKSRNYVSFWVEAIPVFWLILLVLFS